MHRIANLLGQGFKRLKRGHHCAQPLSGRVANYLRDFIENTFQAAYNLFVFLP